MKKNNIIASIVVLIVVIVVGVVTVTMLLKDNSSKGIPGFSDAAMSDLKGKDSYGVDLTKYQTKSKLEILHDKLDLADQNRDTEFYGGRRVNILITGVDSRLGSSYKHADANHIVSIDFSSKTIDIVAIPRDTPTEQWHLDTILADTSGKRIKKLSGEEAKTQLANKHTIASNQIDTNEIFAEYEVVQVEETNIPSNRVVRIDTVYTKITDYLPINGRQKYMDKVAEIGGVTKIHYWVEFGFSQAQGLMEFMGAKDSKSSLQVLRSRKAMKTGDYQRCYNQAQFIRQMLIKYFDNLDGVSGSLILRGCLSLVQTNLSYKQARGIYNKIEDRNFNISHSTIDVTVKPTRIKKFQYINFTNNQTMDSLKQLVNNYSQRTEHENANNNADTIERKIKRKLDNILAKAVRDSSRNSQYVINDLRVYYNQRAWLQISNLQQRSYYRTQITTLLIDAYNNKGNTSKVKEIEYVIEAEKALLGNQEELNEE